MKAGDLDRTVTLLRPTAGVDDGYTTQPGGFENAGTRKARYRPATPREVFENAGREGRQPVIFELRHDSLTRTILPTWRLSMDGKVHEIVGAEEIGRREGVRLVTVVGDES